MELKTDMGSLGTRYYFSLSILPNILEFWCSALFFAAAIRFCWSSIERLVEAASV